MCKMSVLQLVPLLTCMILQTASVSATEYYYISAADGPLCLNDANRHCHNLSYYIMMSDYYFTTSNDAVFHFMKGTHHFDSPMVLTGVADIVITADVGAVLKCGSDESTTISITDSENVAIFNINITDCQAAVALRLSNSYNITLENIKLHSSVSTLIAVNALDIRITDSIFQNNIMMVYNRTINNTDYSHPPTFNIVLQDCIIENSRSTLGGLYIELSQGTEYVVSATVTHTIARNNTSPNMGIVVSNCTTRYSVTMVAIMSVNAIKPLSNAFALSLVESSYASLIVLLRAAPSVLTRCTECSDCSLTIRDSVISHNENGGIFIGTVKAVTIDNCTLSDNSHSALWFQPFGSVADDYYLLIAFQVDTDIVVHNTVVRNTADVDYANPQSCAICLLFVSKIMFESITVEGNNVTGLMAYTSNFYIRGSSNLFAHNKNRFGGGAHITSNSLMILDGPDTAVHFEGNIALQQGGAIYVSSNYYNCFFHTYYNNTRLTFTNNTAGEAGSAIYGNFFYNCPAEVVKYEDMNNSYPVISSPPVRICVCIDGEADCNTTVIRRELYPGQTLSFEALVVGENSQPSVGEIYAYAAAGYKEHFIDQKHSQGSCVKLSTNTQQEGYENDSKILLKSKTSLDTPVDVTIKIIFQECPVGFELSTKTGKCECSSAFQDYTASNNITCDIETVSFTRKGLVWVGVPGNGQECPVMRSCGYDFCTHQLVSFTMNDTDSQCSNDHTGFLCGSCREGMSIVAGAYKCKACSNGYIAVFIPYSIYGVLIIAVIIALNLTVPVGTLNGIIAWANIMQIYSHTLFPTGSSFIEIIPGVLSLTNVIESCLYHEMTTCHRLILEFAFPAYLFGLNALMIVLAHYFKRVAHVMGNRLVPTLATLLLLTYNRIIIITTSIFLRHRVTCDGLLIDYWKLSPNEPYFGGCHLFLTILSTTLCLFFVLPHTIDLLVFPLMEQSRLKKYRIVQKYLIKCKPFHDAYGGPYNDWFRFWVGLMILVRIFLAVVVSLSVDRNANLIVLVVVCVALVLLLSTGRVYNQKLHPWVHMLEIWFFVWLIIMAYLAQSDESDFNPKYENTVNKSLAGVLTAINVVAFTCILAYHVYTYFTPFLWLKKRVLRRWGLTRQRNNSASEENPSHQANRDLEQPTSGEPKNKVVLRKYRPEVLREPVLSYVDSNLSYTSSTPT